MKTLFIDIETAPNLADVWRFYNENISISQVRRMTRVLCFAAKWADEDDVKFWSEWDAPLRWDQDPREVMLRAAWDLLDNADVVVSYNGDHFDIKTLNREFWLMGMPRYAPFVSVDLLKVIKRNFLFPSNKLDFIVQQKGLGRKLPHKGHEMWVDVQAGDRDAQRLIEEYNCHDVLLLERLYYELDTWGPAEINQTLVSDGDPLESCPHCGDTVLIKRGFRYTATGRFRRYVCGACGRWSQSTKREIGAVVKAI